MTLNELVKEIHKNACVHGWWEEERSFSEIVALCHSELSEALEEARNSRPTVYVKADTEDFLVFFETDTEKFGGRKPEGAAVEMADCLIRILDWFGHEGIDLEKVLLLKHEYNKKRPWKHGKAF